jgi:hypothetical protein
VKKRKRVTLSGRVTELVRQGECQTSQAVQLQRKRPSQTTFTTFLQVQTDAQGNFSTRLRVRKTFEYRAQLPEAGGCDDQSSNVEKVKSREKSRSS